MKTGEEGRSEGEGEEVEEEEEEWWRVEGEWQTGEVTETGMWERRGSKAGNSPVVPLVEAGVRGARGEGGGNERERRMRQEREGQREARGLLALEGSQGGTFQA